MSRRRVAIIVVLALTGSTLIQSDAFVRRLAIQRTEEVVNGCVRLDDLAVDLGGYPVALRALRGHVENVSFTATGADIAGLRLTDIRADVNRVRFRVLGGISDIRIHDAEVFARVGADDLDRILGDLGVPGTVHIDDDAVEVQLAGTALGVELEVGTDEGAATLAVAGPLAPLMDLRFEIPGVAVRRVDPSAGALLIEATVNGNPRDVACRAEELVSSRLALLGQLAALLPGS
jgi:hypothetical protein